MRVVIKGLTYEEFGADLSLDEILKLKDNYQEYKRVLEHNYSENRKRGKKNLRTLPDICIKKDKVCFSDNCYLYLEEFESKKSTRTGCLVRCRKEGSIVDVDPSEAVSKITAYLEKFVDGLEFYDQRIELWKKNYVEAEAQGVEALTKFKEVNPRPEKCDDYFQIGKTELNVYNYLPRPRDPYFMMPASMMFMMEEMAFGRLSRRPMPMTDENEGHVSDLIKKIHQEHVDSLRESLKNLKITVLTLEEYDEERWKKLTNAYDQNVTKG